MAIFYSSLSSWVIQHALSLVALYFELIYSLFWALLFYLEFIYSLFRSRFALYLFGARLLFIMISLFTLYLGLVCPFFLGFIRFFYLGVHLLFIYFEFVYSFIWSSFTLYSRVDLLFIYLGLVYSFI